MVGVEDGPEALTVTDLAFLTECRGRGLGSAALRRVLDAADARGLPVRLHVAAQNLGAQRLYVRAGFRTIGDDGVHLTLERPAGAG